MAAPAEQHVEAGQVTYEEELTDNDVFTVADDFTAEEELPIQRSFGTRHLCSN